MYRQQTRQRKKKGKKIEWSKLFAGIVAGCFGVYAIHATNRYYALIELAILTQSAVVPDVALPVAFVTVVIAALLSYLLYQAGLKNSRNKYGIDADGQPFRTKINESPPEDGAVG